MSKNNTKEKATLVVEPKVKKEGTISFKFAKDTFYKDPEKPTYLVGKIYDIPVEEAPRWISRGVQIVGDNDGLVEQVQEPVVEITPEVVQPKEGDKKPADDLDL